MSHWLLKPCCWWPTFARAQYTTPQQVWNSRSNFISMFHLGQRLSKRAASILYSVESTSLLIPSTRSSRISPSIQHAVPARQRWTYLPYYLFIVALSKIQYNVHIDIACSSIIHTHIVVGQSRMGNAAWVAPPASVRGSQQATQIAV